jgi:hypothetical protein
MSAFKSFQVSAVAAFNFSSLSCSLLFLLQLLDRLLHLRFGVCPGFLGFRLQIGYPLRQFIQFCLYRLMVYPLLLGRASLTEIGLAERNRPGARRLRSSDRLVGAAFGELPDRGQTTEIPRAI